MSDVKPTVMAIREELMNYFKGTCIERVTSERNVDLYYLDVPRQPYSYARRHAENEQACGISIGKVQLLTVKHAPERIIFHEQTLNRSPQFREIYKEIRRFMGEYLMGVTLTTEPMVKAVEMDDSKLLVTKARIEDRNPDRYSIDMVTGSVAFSSNELLTATTSIWESGFGDLPF